MLRGAMLTLALHCVMAGGERARPRGSGGAAAQPHRARRAGLAGRKAALRLARRAEGARPGGLRQGRARAQGRARHRHDMVRMPMGCGVRTCPVPLMQHIFWFGCCEHNGLLITDTTWCADVRLGVCVQLHLPQLFIWCTALLLGSSAVQTRACSRVGTCE